jgi:hypothetical protein
MAGLGRREKAQQLQRGINQARHGDTLLEE